MFDLSVIFNNQRPSNENKFLTRLLGLFSEEIVDIWASSRNDKQRYKHYLDEWKRPIIIAQPTSDKAGKRYALDFILQSQEGIFITEMKCWAEFNNYRFLTLGNDPQYPNKDKKEVAEWQLKQVINYQKSFEAFLKMSKGNERKQFTLKGNSQSFTESQGTILIWARVDSSLQGKNQQIGEWKFAEILSLEEMIHELKGNEKYERLVNQYTDWSNRFFDAIR